MWAMVWYNSLLGLFCAHAVIEKGKPMNKVKMIIFFTMMFFKGYVISFRPIFFRADRLDHSLLRLFTGLANAALILW